ncbi:hypothetical protein Tco_0565137 [Tanacetum coccineum]
MVAIASTQKISGSLEAKSIFRAASIRVRFCLSTTPFYSGVQAIDVWLLMTSFSKIKGADDETEDGPVDYPMDRGDDDDGDSSRDDAYDDEEEEHLAPADSAVVVPTINPDSPPEGPKSVIPPPSTDITTTRARITVRLQAFISLPPEAGALVDAVTAAPSPPLPPLPPSVYIPPLVDRKDDLPESELPPRKRLCLSNLGSRYEGISEVGYSIRDTWVDLAEAVLEIAPTTLGEVNTRVTELAELHERDTQDLYALLEDAQDGDNMDCGEDAYVPSQSVMTHIQALLQLQSTLIQTQHQVHETRSQIQQTKMAELQDTNRRHKAQMVEILRVMRD